MELVAFAPQTGGNLAAFVPQTGGKLAEWGLTLQSSLDEYWEQAAVRCHTRSAHQQAACADQVLRCGAFNRDGSAAPPVT